MAPNERRLGRPPASNSAATKSRILAEARRCFADNGFEASTNKMLADRADITTGAIYHYFGSKLDLFVDVHRHVHQVMYDRLDDAVEPHDSFQAKLGAIFDAILELQGEDPWLARFLVAARTDMGRIPELETALRPFAGRRDAFFAALVDTGVTTGEIDADKRQMTLDVVAAMLIGLTNAGTASAETHRSAVRGFRELWAGALARSSEPV
ncbi:MAG: TetR/AcrR family transcriptional regulator [Acidimicrobiia bacterium]|nr:TetR/AcrR family transcriptional regulator [Acidimicrobiia bacterium]